MKKFASIVLTLITGLLAGCVSLSPGTSALSLDTKLAREYQRYDQAQRLVLARYEDASLPFDQPRISRTEWETLLAPTPEETLSPDDMQMLKKRHALQIAAAREAAVRASIIDFSAWRALPAKQSEQAIRAFCEAVPKGGMLHVHPWGTLSRKTFSELLAKSNPVIPSGQYYRDLANQRGLAWLYPDEIAWLGTLPDKARFLSLPEAERERLVSMAVLPPGTHPFERFEAVFNFVALVMIGEWDNITKAYDDFAERAVRAGVQYAEFTEAIAPEDVPRYERLAERLASRYGLTVRFNIAYFRTRTPASQHEAVKAMIGKINSPVIVGIDLLASEKNAPALETAQAVYGPVMAANAGKTRPWRRTMHAGEHGDGRNTRDALLLGAERIGHGVRLIKDPITLQYAASKRIPVEINLISNLRLRAVDDISDHPYLTYLRLGMPVSLSTDDEGIFETDLNDECVLAVGRTDLTYHEFKEMAFNSLRTSFATEDVKRHMLNELQRRFDRFEQARTVPQLPQ